MNKSLQLAHWLLVIFAIVSTIVTIQAAVTLWQASKINHFINNINDYEQVPEHPMAQFAQAYNDAEVGEPQLALDRLTQIVTTEDAHLQTEIYYNRGNIHLLAAQSMLKNDPKQISSVELAKQDYRTALLLDPSLWDVRFNLAIALRMVPEQPDENALFDKPTVLQQKSIESVGFRVELP